MVKKILGTIGTRALSALIALVVWTLNARYLGPEQVGTISLVIFSVAIIQLFTNFMAGAALIYYAPRAGIYRLFIPAYTWIVVVTITAAILLHLAGGIHPVLALIPTGYFPHVLALSLVMSFASANNMLLLGMEKVRASNLLNLMQMVLLITILASMLFGARQRDVMAYYWAILLSWSLSLAAGIALLAPHLVREPFGDIRSLCRDILRFGTYVQFANIFQTMNYRLSLKFTDHFLGRGAVGILSLGMQLAEGLWLISRSMATVQLSRLSNAMDDDYSKRITLTLAKLSLVVTAFAMLLLLAFPASLFRTVFTDRFGDIKLVILSLSPGIVVLSVSMILSGYFSAVNKPYHNTVGSALGLLFTVALGIFLIPRYGIAGAGFSASVSYTIVTLYQLVVFMRMTKLGFRDLLFRWDEIVRLVKSVSRES